MTRDEITRMAREAGFVGMDGQHGALSRFAALVAAAEREVCAKALEAAPQPPKLSDERIWEIYDELVAEVAKGGSMFNFARAIERELLGGEHE